MKEELKNNLLEYLGELMQEKETTFEWMAKDELTRKIRAVNILLGLRVPPDNTFVERLNDFILNNRP